MKKIIVFVFSSLTILIMVGCTAHSITYSRSSKYGPKDGKKSLGMVKYLNAGAGFIIENRRESAYKAMYEDCGGKNYKIEYEEPNGEYWNIYYRCY